MTVLGIIAEYNPFHNGHIYHIQKSKEMTKSNYVIVVMSGNFTQQGNIAIYDKFSRAKIATQYGADLVIELPTIYANASSESFAYGAIHLLNSLSIVDYLSFGSEADHINLLNNIAFTLIQHEKAIWKSIKVELEKGISFASARENALKIFLSKDEMAQIYQPNNILAIEYLKWIQKLHSPIKPIAIQRISSDYHEITLNSSDSYTSATSIRSTILGDIANIEQNLNKLSKYVPSSTLTQIKNSIPTSNEDIFQLIKYSILTKTIPELKTIQEVTEGLENKLINAINHAKTYEEFIMNLKSKRYQLSKIKRMLINILLDIKKEDMTKLSQHHSTYAHVLACNEKGKELLSQITKTSHIDLITSMNDKKLKEMQNQDIAKLLHTDILASNIYSSIHHEKINKDYTNKL